MTGFFFVSDLHGKSQRYAKLFQIIEEEQPAAVLFGGDLLPPFGDVEGFLDGLFERIGAIRDRMDEPPEFVMILGNDDPRIYEERFLEADRSGTIRYAGMRRLQVGGTVIFGYPFVPPSPFLLKDWELYDMSAYIDPGNVPPEEGHFTVDVDRRALRFRTIQQDLSDLTGCEDLSDAVMLFHAPPYNTGLDLAGIKGLMYDHAPLDPHVGSIAIRRFIEQRGPLLTLHGHIHESARLSEKWIERIGETVCITAAHDGRDLALVRFDLRSVEAATREVITC
ncbi:MAG: metallophosphoesterase [Candidatus Thermoplasmatota archaeon]|nr:metallophosphoesterase [Candidatus Thermoplasmatota archaeon]